MLVAWSVALALSQGPGDEAIFDEDDLPSRGNSRYAVLDLADDDDDFDQPPPPKAPQAPRFPQLPTGTSPAPWRV